MAQAGPKSAGGILTIDLGAIRANYALLQQRLAGVACAAVVKADAYGLGAAQVAPALARSGCRHFFVAHLDEAIALRPRLPAQAEIFVLNGLPAGTEAICLAHQLTPVLNSLAEVDAWAGLARDRGQKLPAILQVDTGMSRLGFSRPELATLADNPGRLNGIALRYIMSHLACAEHQDSPMNTEQRDRFRRACQALPLAPASLANSSGIFLGPDFHFDLARPGAALYGIAPVAGKPNPMQPVIRLQGRIIQIREIEAGAAAGYGATWRASTPRRLATVSVGYADGFPRSLSNRGIGFAGGTPIPLAGMVSMDTTIFDVSEVPSEMLGPGDFIDLIGEHNPVDAVASRAGTIGYQILTSLGRRYHRHYVGSDEPGG
ncbi:MAG: alanine racemase [Acetobacteraceae bacterium]|nr:alanine racemase [Acetobacteraceae bacterium]MBV8525838.1 alanine racemase [Acetobacteraceae bacterium]